MSAHARDQCRRASTTASSPNGSTKKSSSIAPWRTSFVQRNVRPSHATNSASGFASGPSSRAALAVAEQLPRERDRGHGDDAVERKQQIRLRRADVHRDAGGRARERREREQPRDAHARVQPPADRRDQAEHRRSRKQAVMPVRREVDDETGAADRPGAEPSETEIATVRGDERREPDGAESARDLCDARAHATTTEQTAVWLPTVRYRRYTPADCGARRCSVPRGRLPCRPWRSHSTCGASVETRSANRPPGRTTTRVRASVEVPNLSDREGHTGRLVAGAVLRREAEHVPARRKRLRRARTGTFPFQTSVPFVFWPFVNTTCLPRSSRIACAGSLTSYGNAKRRLRGRRRRAR